MVLPQSLMIASLLGMLVLALQHTVTQQTASVQARLDGLRQREWAWVGLQAALRDIHAPRTDARHPAQVSPAPTPLPVQALFIPGDLSQWQTAWSTAMPNQCHQGLCTELTQAQDPQSWTRRLDGVSLPPTTESPWPLMYWIEPLRLESTPTGSRLVFRITVTSGPQVWQGWWLPQVASDPTVQGEWLSLLRLESP